MEVCNTQFFCGTRSEIIRKFNGQTKIEQVYECVRQIFRENLPTSYRILYYDPNKPSFVDLRDQLRNGFNPFHVNLSNHTNSIQLYIVVDTHSQTGTEDDQIVSNGIYDENSRSTDDRSLTVTSILANPPVVQNRSRRLQFSLDVKPNQRDIYKSDQFNVREEKTTGRIARVQGVKREDQKMLQVLPKLRIPPIDLQSNVTLVVTVVSEVVNNGMTIWHRHLHKSFLPEGYGKHTEPINPIQFNLNRNNVSKDGEYTLNLQMITKWNKSQTELVPVHQLDDQTTRTLHSARTEPNTPRLLCVLQRNGVTDWDTFCLSDFIRTPKSSRERSSSVTIENNHSPDRKRSKTSD